MNKKGLCLYYGLEGHLLPLWLVRPACSAVIIIHISPSISSLARSDVILMTSHQSISVKALIDSGAARNLISLNLLRKLHLGREHCPQDLHEHSILGKPLGRGLIHHCFPTLTLCIGCLHQERTSFMVLEGSTADNIMGRL